MNREQRNVLVVSLSLVALVTGVWAVVVVPVLSSAEGGSFLEAMPHPLFWGPLLIAIFSGVGAAYLRAGGRPQS